MRRSCGGHAPFGRDPSSLSILAAMPDSWHGHDDQRTPTVSVILATFDRRELLIRAISSVQAQAYEDWELIVVDDGSTDGSAEEVIRLAHQDRPRLEKSRVHAKIAHAGR